MKRNDKKTGFTLVELQVGVIAMGFLALTVGLILYYGWVSWRETNEIVNMQRDASIAMRAMAREIRNSNINGISDGNPLICVNTNGTTRFEWSGDKLTASGGLNMELVSAGMTRFTTVKSNNVVRLALSLSAGGIVNNSVVDIAPRNSL